jgi:hypothetical protein
MDSQLGTKRCAVLFLHLDSIKSACLGKHVGKHSQLPKQFAFNMEHKARAASVGRGNDESSQKQ